MLFILFHVRKIAKLKDHLEKQLQVLYNNKEVQHNNELKEEIRHHLHMHALQIRDVVYKQTKSPIQERSKKLLEWFHTMLKSFIKRLLQKKQKG
ncbi:hypothetical protein [Alteribacillus bidgolensis]|uniref:hypothetical protein n=1 Tax=Alteribacillus bidgolensis TaxID=930129 RepID=UPI000B818BE2|nr:hypothetical protein [Alteribacillus bidgolensis]